jgi:hypothetical protein
MSQGQPLAPVLVRYRLVGGPAGVDQRLTVFEDGRVELEEHHRSRDDTGLTIPAPELEEIRTALEEIPEGLWLRGPKRALRTAVRAISELFTFWPRHDLGRANFQITRSGRAIAGKAGEETEAEPARELLDSLRVHVVRLAEEQKPTGGPI